MFTILGIAAYIALLVILFRIMLWVTKVWLKLTVGLIEFALVAGAIALLV